MDDFDPVEVYIAIADFEGLEDANISLTAGQWVQVKRQLFCYSVKGYLDFNSFVMSVDIIC